MRGLATIPHEASRSPGSCRSPLGPGPRTGVVHSGGRLARGARGVAPDPELVEAIAVRVVELLKSEAQPAREPRYIDAAGVAREYSVERDWVYANKAKLGGFRLGGPRGRLRFDRKALGERLGPPPVPEPPYHRRKSRPTRPAEKSSRPGIRRSLKPGFRIPVPDDLGSDDKKRRRRAGGRTPTRAPQQRPTGGSPE
jgi:hypothetical protein